MEKIGVKISDKITNQIKKIGWKMEKDSIIERYVTESWKILGENLVGIYLHGSVVMGCFNPEKSDLDFIVVVENDISDDTKLAYVDMVLTLNADAPAKGIEMSIVRRDVCMPFVYPTPFLLHFSEHHIKWVTENPKDYVQKMKGTDIDLAAHFTNIRAHGKCLYGLPVTEVFGEVPSENYFDSVWNDICDAPSDIAENTMYIALNLPRVLAFLKEGILLSKKEGGEWALKNLPEDAARKFAPIIQAALAEYTQNVAPHYNLALAKEYAEYMLAEIKDFSNRQA